MVSDHQQPVSPSIHIPCLLACLPARLCQCFCWFFCNKSRIFEATLLCFSAAAAAAADGLLFLTSPASQRAIQPAIIVWTRWGLLSWSGLLMHAQYKNVFFFLLLLLVLSKSVCHIVCSMHVAVRCGGIFSVFHSFGFF